MPIKRLPTNSITANAGTNRCPPYPEPANNSGVHQREVALYQGGSVMKEKRIRFVLKLKFLGFFLKTDKLPKHKCLLSPAVILEGCTVNYHTKRVSEGTHREKAMGNTP